MARFIFLRSNKPTSGGGGDFTPSALNWGDITVTGTGGYENNYASRQTLAGINEAITLRAAWTSTSASPAWGQWIKNGVAVQAPAPTPVDVVASVNDVLYFAVWVAQGGVTGNYDTGVVTVTNRSDSNTVLDTFNHAAQFVYSGPGSGDLPDVVVEGGDKHQN